MEQAGEFMKHGHLTNGHRGTTIAPESVTKNKKSVSLVATNCPENNEPIREELALALRALSATVKMPVLSIIQYGPPCPSCSRETERSQINSDLYSAVKFALKDVPRKHPIAVVLESPGGYAKDAFKIARFLRRHCGAFIAVVPNYAKSAATLLALGAEQVLMGPDAELGPLDAQVDDFDREQHMSALEVVQSLERLNEAAMESVDSQIVTWALRSRKKIDTLMPMTMRFVSDMMRPLFEKIDTVQYTRYARVLKVAQEYAVRLLGPKYETQEATNIARALTESYPDHDFAICPEEAKNLGINVVVPTGELGDIIKALSVSIDDESVIGLIKEASHEHKKDPSGATKNGASNGNHKRRPVRKDR
jgi:hypothetical protein